MRGAVRCVMTFRDEPMLLFHDGTHRPVAEMLAPENLMEQRLLRWLKVAHQFPGERGRSLLAGVVGYYGARTGAAASARSRLALIAQSANPDTQTFDLALACAMLESGVAAAPVPLWHTDDAVYVDPNGVLRDANGDVIDDIESSVAVAAR